MKRREIARSTWPDFFASFVGQHEGWLVDVDRIDELFDESIETQHRDGALRAVSSEAGGVALVLDDRASGHLETELIHDPQRVVLEQSESDVDTGLEIDGSR